MSESAFANRLLESFSACASNAIERKDLEYAHVLILAAQGSLSKLEAEGIIKKGETFERFWYRFDSMSRIFAEKKGFIDK